MKARRLPSRDQLMFGTVLFLFAFLAVLLWLQDPAHRYSGKSRVGWPAPARPKP